MALFSRNGAVSDSGNVSRLWAASLEEEINPPSLSSLLHDNTYYLSIAAAADDDDDELSRSVAALGGFGTGYTENDQHAYAYAAGATDVEIANVDQQHMRLDPHPSGQTMPAVDWWNWLALPGCVPTFPGLQGKDPLAGDWKEPGMPSPAIAENLAWLSPMHPPQPVARNIAKDSAHIARRDPQSYTFVSQSLCCKFLPKCMLQEGPLPSWEQTQEYLCHELGLPPDSTISLALNEKLRTSGRARTQTWCLNARVACILAIWGSEPKALTTHELLQALIDNIPYCYKNRRHAVIRYAGAKRKDWAATVLYQLSRSRIFVLKTLDGQPSKHWRIDVRGADYVTRRCSHIRHNY